LPTIVDTFKVIVGKRWPVFCLLFAAEIALIVLVTNLSFFPGEFNTYQQQHNSVSGILGASATNQVGGIFANNFRVAMIEIIPALGLAIFSFSMYETARIVQVIGIEKPIGAAEALVTLFILPSTWLELPAYSIAATESLYLLYAIFYGFKHGWARFRRELRFLFVNVLLIGGVLGVAAIFEVAEIQLSSSQDIVVQALALATWLPFLLILAGVIMFWRKARREAPVLEAQEETERAGSMLMPLSVVIRDEAANYGGGRKGWQTTRSSGDQPSPFCLERT
jgi:uncharacterized membrane protein SpoIIM required for sporulation